MVSLPLEPLGLLTLPEARKGFQLGEAELGTTRQTHDERRTEKMATVCKH